MISQKFRGLRWYASIVLTALIACAADAAAQSVSADYWLWDGIHPLPQGHELIARHWLHAVSADWAKGAAAAVTQNSTQ